MEPENLVILVAIGTPIFAVFGVTAFFLARELRRREDAYSQKVRWLAGWARSRGWTYQETDTSPVGFTGEPFNLGLGWAGMTHVFRGRHRGHQLLGFEYESVRPGSQNNPRFVVAAIATLAPRPSLQVSHEAVRHRLLELGGVRDLQLESEEFNRTFRIDTDRDKFAYDVLHPRMMEWLLADPRARQTPFRFEGSWLLCWGEAEMDPRYVIGMADFLVDVLERVPEFVWR